MSLLDNMPHKASAYRRVRTIDDLGGADDAYSFLTFSDRDCWLQPVSDNEVRTFQKRGIDVNGKVFFTSDPGLDTRHAVTVNDADGNSLGTWLVKSRPLPDTSVGLAVLYKVMVEESTTGSTPDSVLGEGEEDISDALSNAENIAANTAAIESNDVDIAANGANISGNDTDIAANVLAIAVNGSGIAANDVELASIANYLDAVVMSEDQEGSDIGVRVNAAIVKLGADGGIVQLPDDSHDYSTPIDFGNRDNICLQGFGMPIRNTNQLGGNLYLGTELHYTGTGSAILLGPASGGQDNNRCADCRLQNFNLRFDATADYGVYLRSWATQMYLRDLGIRGTSDSGTGLYMEGVGNNSLMCDTLQIRDCNVGADFNGPLACNVTGGSAFNGNNIGVRVGNDVIVSVLNFWGTDMESNDEICVDIVDGESINLYGVYSEIDGANNLFVRIGSGAERPDSINIEGCRVVMKNSANYAIEVSRVLGLNVNRNMFIGGAGHVVNNVKTQVRQIELLNNEYGENNVLELINDTEGVVRMTDRDGRMIYPNMPTASAGLPSGALWSDGGAIKIV